LKLECTERAKFKKSPYFLITPRIYIWNKKETLLLIYLYKKHEEMFISGKMKQHLCWQRIATQMQRKQYLRKKMLHKVPDIKKNIQTNKRPQ